MSEAKNTLLKRYFKAGLSFALIMGQTWAIPLEAKKKIGQSGAEGNAVGKPRGGKSSGAEGNRVLLASLGVNLNTDNSGAEGNNDSGQTEDRSEEGRRDGAAAGRAAGQRDGQARGREEGYRSGFRTCEAQMERRAYDRGYEQGSREGDREGDYKGEREGADEGQERGRIDGYNDGKGRASSDARSEAYPRGRDQGYEEANQSDARERGEADGIAEGDARAWSDAYAREYPRGRQDYRQSRWAEEVINNNVINMRPNFLAHAGEALPFGAAFSSPMAAPNLGGSFFAKGMGPLSLNTMAQNDGGYQDAYDRAYRRAYQAAYQNAYSRAYSNAETRGCQEARSRDYSDDVRRGRRAGYRDAYDKAYRRAYRVAYRREYRPAFNRASRRAYDEWYSSYYDQYFEEGRSEAYAERYNDLYRQYYDPAYRETYDAKYPGYASTAYQMGVDAETEDFRLRPVRMLEGVEVVETIPNGVYEPGEELHVNLSMRNFANNALAGNDVQVSIQAVNSRSVVIGEASAVLPTALMRKSITEVQNALSFTMTDADKDKVASFVVSVSYQGRGVGSDNVQFTTQYLLGMTFESEPRLQEGIMSPLFVMVTNRGNVDMPAGTLARLTADADWVEFESNEQALEAIPAGGSVGIQYRALVRSSSASVDIPFVFEATEVQGRRVSAVDLTKRVPLLNDYRVGVTDGSVANKLTQTGLVRVPYRIKNISSRLLFKGLQLKARFIGGANEDSHSVLGPDPQYIRPLQQGETTEFMIPVLVRKAGASGTLEIEVKEDGQTVVIHQLEF